MKDSSLSSTSELFESFNLDAALDSLLIMSDTTFCKLSNSIWRCCKSSVKVCDCWRKLAKEIAIPICAASKDSEVRSLSDQL